ncbi:RsiV family protein [Filibacter tadaridae]|uniref:Anti-sigma-V factor RsiV n=1 Tax=Filibacter tadaridae TaxID=2483811 RepID=A0A3P5WYN5_9BACL|nr:RsiV family protein [Filibacter tadaridae]VDC20054.1 Anti-sigma-V factor RsiV [Filibacter tadaridae]
MKRLNKLKENHEKIEIPAELEDIVKQSIQQGKKAQKKHGYVKQWPIGTVAAAAVFIGSVNVSPNFAQAMANVPVLGSIVEVFTVQQWTNDKDNFQADVATPAIDGLADEELQASLNEKYVAESETKYAAFEKEMAALKAEGGGHFSLDSNYKVLVDTEQLFTLARYDVEIQASGYETVRYDTIDKVNGLLLSLPALFKDDKYIDTINTYLLGEMERQMAEDSSKSFFLDKDIPEAAFQSINPEQDFYITEDHKLVLSFDEYEIAPGYMGVVTFEIPTEVIKDSLVSDTYVN